MLKYTIEFKVEVECVEADAVRSAVATTYGAIREVTGFKSAEVVVNDEGNCEVATINLTAGTKVEKGD